LRFEVTSCRGESPDDVIKTIRSKAAAAQQSQDLFLFFYLGHGVLSPDLRLEFLHPSRDSYSTLALARVEKTVAAEEIQKSLFIIDCCYAGARTRTFPSTLTDQHCRLASTTPAALAYVVTRRADDPLGVFSRAILDGFASSEACISPADNSITAESLFKYARARTLRETDGVQVPTMVGYLTDQLGEYRADRTLWKVSQQQTTKLRT